MHRAIFLDRDGVLVEDVELLTSVDQIRVPDDVPGALTKWKEDGYRLVVVSNQTVIARGLVDEQGVRDINAEIERRIRALGGPAFDAVYFCPHHPNATVDTYRKACECRKPREGMIVRACADLDIDPKQSLMVGDRITDILAGQRAGCRTILLETGRHGDAPIVTDLDLSAVTPDRRCATLAEAAAS